MWTQIVGKIRLSLMPWQNHSWHVTLYISPNGLSTGSIPYQDGMIELLFDFAAHRFEIHSTHRDTTGFALDAMSVKDFYQKLMSTLKELDIEVDIHASPNEVEPSIPFEENETDNSYDKQAISNCWQVAVSTYKVFSKFRSDFIGKCNPVHFFWGAFDIAVTRFSGRPAPLHQGEMPNMPKAVMQEAYSQEVSSAGFWPGSDDFPQPMFYAYAYPSPEGYDQTEVGPKEAFWSPEMGEWFLPYDAVRNADDPDGMLMEFLQSSYVGAADLATWDREVLER